METKHLYIIRHGETEFNRQKIVQGCGVDSDLNEVGILQAKAFFEMYRELPIDKIYISKLKRTFQTVLPFINSGIPYQKLEGLNEISWGNKEGRPLNLDDDEQYKEMTSAWKRGEYHWKVDTGESPLEVQQRQAYAMKYILANSHEKNVLICMHGRALRVLLCTLLGMELKHMDSFGHTNTCLYHLELKNGGYHVHKANAIEHLEGLHQAMAPHIK